MEAKVILRLLLLRPECSIAYFDGVGASIFLVLLVDIAISDRLGAP